MNKFKFTAVTTNSGEVFRVLGVATAGAWQPVVSQTEGMTRRLVLAEQRPLAMHVGNE